MNAIHSDECHKQDVGIESRVLDASTVQPFNGSTDYRVNRFGGSSVGAQLRPSSCNRSA